MNNVHIIYNISKKKSEKYKHLFSNENKNKDDDKNKLMKSFDARIDVKDLETAFVTVKFHSQILDLATDDRETIVRAFDKVISNLYMSAADWRLNEFKYALNKYTLN